MDAEQKRTPTPGAFKKGDARINRGGRPKGLAAWVNAQTNDGIECAKLYLGVMRDTEQKLEHRLTAADWLAVRGQGKPIQRMEADVEGKLEIFVHQVLRAPNDA